MPDDTRALDDVPHRLVIQISDTHVVHEGLLHDRVDSFGSLEAIMVRIESADERPDAIVLSGDLADTGHPDAYKRLGDLVGPVAERLGAAVCYMPGNHDDRQVLRETLTTDTGAGPLDQVVWAGGLRIVALDSTVPGAHHGELSDLQLEWLESELAQPAPEGTIVALHHPPIFSPSPVVSMLSLHEPERLGAVVCRDEVMMVLAGHSHHATAGLLAGVPVWVATASAYQADVLGDQSMLRGIPGVAFTRIDVVDHACYATQVPMAIGEPPVYEHSLAGLRERLAALASSR